MVSALIVGSITAAAGGVDWLALRPVNSSASCAHAPVTEAAIWGADLDGESIP